MLGCFDIAPTLRSVLLQVSQPVFSNRLPYVDLSKSQSPNSLNRRVHRQRIHIEQSPTDWSWPLEVIFSVILACSTSCLAFSASSFACSDSSTARSASDLALSSSEILLVEITKSACSFSIVRFNSDGNCS